MSHNYKNLAPFSYIAVGGLFIQCILHLGSVLTGFGQILVPDLIFEDVDGTPVSIWFGIQGLVLLPWLPLYVLTAVFFLIWLYRAHSNLPLLRPSFLKYTPGWAVGYWFIPFINLYRPYQVVREVWWESDPEIPEEQMFLTESLHNAPSYMGLWWAFWLGFNFLSNITYRIVWDPEDLNTVTISGYFFVIQGIMVIAAGALLIHSILDISERQSKRHDRILTEMYSVPPPDRQIGEV